MLRCTSLVEGVLRKVAVRSTSSLESSHAALSIYAVDKRAAENRLFEASRVARTGCRVVLNHSR